MLPLPPKPLLFVFLQVDTNGHVDFTETPLGARIYPHNFPSTGRMSVSPFGIDLDNSVNTDNQVYYAIYTSENISLISDSISKVVDVSSDFDGTYRPKWAMVVTWEDQAYFSNKSLEVSFIVTVLVNIATFYQVTRLYEVNLLI